MPHWWPFGKTYTHKCPDGSIAIIHRDINTLFPLGLRDYDASAKAGGKVDEFGSLNVDLKYKSGVKSVLVAIDELNGSYIFDCRSAYSTYLTDPCGKREFLERATDRIRESRHRLVGLRMRVNALIEVLRVNPQGSPAASDTLCELKQSLGLADPAEAAAEAIAAAAADAQKMIG